MGCSPPGSSVYGDSQESWNGLPCPPSGDLPDLGIEPRSPALQADSLPAERQGKPWISCRCTYIPFLLHLLPSPPHPTPLGWSRAPEFPETHSKFLLAIYFTHGDASFRVSLSIHLTLSSPLPVSISLFSMSVSLPANKFFSTSFLDSHIYALIYNFYLSLSDLTSLCIIGSSFIHLIRTDSDAFLLWLTNIPLCICTTTSLSIHLSDI